MPERRITSRQVAEQAGVSRTTVSFVLNGVRTGKVSEATRQRVLQAAAELGYVPDAAARTLVSGKTATIGLVVNNAEHLRIDAFINSALHSLTTVCSANGYRLLVETSDLAGQSYDYGQLVAAKQIDGLVVINPNPEDPRLADLIDRAYPMALLGNHPDPRVVTVSVDSFAAMRHATAHMLGLGHARIGFIHYRKIGRLDEGGRFGGYRAALGDAGVLFDECLVQDGDYSAESGYRAMRALMAQSAQPTAVMVGNDTVAIGAIAAISESGLRVPDDIAVVGFDDIPIARYISPSLTTIHLPAVEMAEAAGEVVMGIIGGSQPHERRIRFPTRLVVRHSCGARLLATPVEE